MRTIARNASAMKLHNMLEIIGLVRTDYVSRADIARVTGLTRAAVTIITDRLIGEGILSESGARADGRSNKPILLEVRDDCFYFMGVDITRVDCTVGIIDIKGRLLHRIGFDLSRDDDFNQVLPHILSAIGELRERMGDDGQFQGIGVSVPGPVDPSTGMVLNPPDFAMLKNQPVLDRLESVLDCDVWIDNNAIARTFYEKNLGAGRRFTSFMVMIVDTGIGSGLVLDGKLYRGMGFAGEIGHTSIYGNGEPCVCGGRGCLERYASIPALLHREGLVVSGITPWKAVVDGAEAGDERCLSIIECEANYLSRSIANTVNLLDLEAVILTGYAAYRPAMLLDRIRCIVEEQRITRAIHGLDILASSGREQTGVISAAMIGIEKFFSGETEWGRLVKR